MNSPNDKLDKLFALFERAGSEGERIAAGDAIQRLLAKHSLSEADDHREWTYTFPDFGSSRLFRCVCKKYGLETYRYKRQKHTTVNVKMPEEVQQLVDKDFDGLWDQWQELTRGILGELVERFERGDPDLLEDASNKGSD